MLYNDYSNYNSKSYIYATSPPTHRHALRGRRVLRGDDADGQEAASEAAVEGRDREAHAHPVRRVATRDVAAAPGDHGHAPLHRTEPLLARPLHGELGEGRRGPREGAGEDAMVRGLW